MHTLILFYNLLKVNINGSINVLFLLAKVVINTKESGEIAHTSYNFSTFLSRIAS